MNFDALVTRLETSLLPSVRKHETELRESVHFTDIEVISLRHGDVIHAMGITCRPVWASEELEHLSYSATLNGIEGLSGRIDIQWSQTFMPSTGSGYVKKETGGFHSKLESDTDIARFEEEWSRLLKLFKKVAMKGHPSNRFFRRFRGAPPDLHGYKEVANKPVETSRL